MSIHFVKTSGRYVVRIRDIDGHNRNITVNEKNLRKYDQPLSNRITERVARKLEQAVLARETMVNGALKSRGKQNLLWFDIVARYLPPLINKAGRDTWGNRPLGELLQNEKAYSRNQLDRMQRVLAVYFPAYLDHGRIGWGKKGKRNHGHTTKVYTCARRIDNITPEDVAGFQIYLTQSGLASSTVRGYMTTLKTFLSWCVVRSYLLVNPAADVKLPPHKKGEVRWLERDNAKKLLKVVKGHVLEGVVRTILGLGLRRSEMVRLEWRDINFDADIVRVRGTKTDNALREVPLPKDLAKFFQKLPRFKEIPNVLCNTDGRPWNKDSLNSSLCRFRRIGSFPIDWNFQMLRATYGSLLVQQGIPIAHVSMALGHSDVRITQWWYIGLRSTHVAPEISKAIGRALS